jgi:hypothetical protein
MRSSQVPSRSQGWPPEDPGGTRPVKTITELFTDWYLRQGAHVHGARRDGPGRDWRLIRAAEANARQTGMRASLPDPAAAGTPAAADLARWGDGRGIGPGSTAAPGEPDGPEAGQ